MNDSSGAIMGPPPLPGTRKRNSSNTVTNKNTTDMILCSETGLFIYPEALPAKRLASEDKNDATTEATKTIMGPPPPPGAKTKRKYRRKKSAELMSSEQLKMVICQRARECRQRKLLRYQYLEELVDWHEQSVFALREELEKCHNIVVEIDANGGKVPDHLAEVIKGWESEDLKQSSHGAPSKK